MRVYVNWIIPYAILSDWGDYWDGTASEEARERVESLPLMGMLVESGRPLTQSDHLFNTVELDADDDLLVWLKLMTPPTPFCRVYTRLHELRHQYDDYEDFKRDLEARLL